jgi:hypothetical protein
MATEWKYHDGGRSQYFKGTGNDCVARAIAIAGQLDYKEVYDMLAAGNKGQRKSKFKSKSRTDKRTALHGINTRRVWFRQLMKRIGFSWIATMHVGQGCKTHLCASELPAGRLVVAVSGHYTAVIDGVVHDTWNPSRIKKERYNGQQLKSNQWVGGGYLYTETRCVYGYWALES